MDPQGAEVAVFVVAGSWECSNTGVWDFYIAKECYARSIPMSMDTSYEELLVMVRKEFELDALNFKPKVSYWLPSELSIFSLNARPPVVITSSMGVRNFLEVKRTAPHLNMLLSLDHESSAAEGTVIRKQCGVETGKGKAIAADVNIDDVPRLTIGRSGMGGIGDAGTSHFNTFSGVRRRLFDDNDASYSNGALRMYSVAANGQGNCSRRSGLQYHDDPVSPDSNTSGLIRLADAGTPSLSVHTDGSNSGDVDVNNFLVSEEDDGFMREIAEIEERCTQSRLLEGKDKGKGTEDGIGENENETSWTDAVVSSGSDEDDICNDEYWSMVFDQDFPGNLRDPLVEKDTSPNVVERERGNGSEDIGETVLAYCAQRSEAALRSDMNITDADIANVNDTTVVADRSPRGCERNEGLIGVEGLAENVDSAATEGGYGETSESSASDEVHGATGSNVVGDANIVGDVTAGDRRHIHVDRSRHEGGPRIELNNVFTSSLHLPDADNGGTGDPAFEDFTQRRDAEPVFDDVYQLTNTNGCATVAAEEDAIFIGRVFKDKAEMQNTLAIYAIKRLFHFRLAKSEPERIICVCVDPLCAWRVFGHSVSKFSKNFEIRTATLTHTCSITARSQYEKQASTKVIAEMLKAKYANGLPGPRAVDIPAIVLEELKVSITYMKAWYAREAAIIKTRGSDEYGYKLLAVYLHLLKKGNPGTIYKLEYTGGGVAPKQFKYLFFAIGACIAGIKHMRKVVLVDGTVIKNKFKGVLIAASMQDANFQVFPIAFAIVDAENDLAWTWFFRQLSMIVPDSKDLVLVSDRHRSIYNGVDNVYPQAFHGACAVHIERNVRAKFHGEGLSNLMGKAARAFNVGDFDESFNEIAARNKKCAAYLDAIPREHWTQAFCPAKRYNIMSSNIAESLNGVLGKILELPIVSMVESIRSKLMEWFCIRREKGRRLLALGQTITPNVNKLLLRHQTFSAGLAVKGVSAWSFQVSNGTKMYYVDFVKKTCTCLQFQKLQIPCCHALAAARMKQIDVQTLVGSEYEVKLFAYAYAEFIYPVPNQCDEDVPADVEETEFIPPTNKNGPGRRRKRRIPSTGEFMGNKRRKRGANKCSICFQSKHNRATCSNMPA